MYLSPLALAMASGEITSGWPPGAVERLTTPRVRVRR